jgi:hypothetical protein
VGGHLFLFASQNQFAESSAAPVSQWGIERVDQHPYVLRVEGNFMIVIFEKKHTTSKQFPRPWKKIKQALG